MTSTKPYVSYVLFLCAVMIIAPASLLHAQVVKFGNSYLNVTKQTTGGTVQNNDILEIRTCTYFPTGFNGNTVFSPRYVDNIPSNTVYVANSMRTITNEGLTYKGFLDAAAGDAAIFLAAPPAGQFNVRINVARTATAPINNTAASINGTSTTITGNAGARDRPRVGGGILIATAFRVRVTGTVGDTITLGAGQVLFRRTALGVDTILNVTRYRILIANNDPICAGAVGRNFVAEAGGTFDSGLAQNRSYGPTFTIPGYVYTPLTPATSTVDGAYTIVNNLSPLRSTQINSRRQPNCTVAPGVPVLDSCKNRMHGGFWEIIGDHTGSTTPAGNPPKDSATGGTGGYMLVVNADYITSEAYRQTIRGLCRNTSYEFSLWVRNVCNNCGIDSNATQTYIPGVRPNLTFAIDNLDRYSSGECYDSLGWVKKGFLFRTGPSQDSITISIRNNASGGGGNDWAIDDIALVTCNPNLDMQPTGNAQVCIGNQFNMQTQVTAFFNNYINWTWEISTNGGATWSSTGVNGTGTPVASGGNFTYTAVFPSFIADSNDHMNRYRFKVASSPLNLADPNCSFIATTTVVVMVDNCHWILTTDILSFNGRLADRYANLQWTTGNEDANTIYEIERSSDGMHFTKVGTVSAGSGAMPNRYTFTDPKPVTGNTLYRIKIAGNNSAPSGYKYSRTILLSNNLDLQVRSLVNPFKTNISFELVTPHDGSAVISLVDMYGRIIRQQKENILRGTNIINMDGLSSLSKGVYSVRIQVDDKIINRLAAKL